MTTFSLKFTSSTGFTEGQTGIGFRITWDGAVAKETKLHWEVIFSGRLPLSASDFVSGFVRSGTYTVPVSTAAGQSAIIPLNILNDNIAEPIQDLVIRLSLANTNTNTDARIDTITNTDPTDYSTTVADDDTSTAVRQLVGGNSNANVFTAGENTPFEFQGAGGNDQYIITRYQTANMSITDRLGDDVIKFDIGVSIDRAFISFAGDGIIDLTNGARIVVLGPTRLKYQLGDGELMVWNDPDSNDDFIGTVSGGYTVSTYLDAINLGAGQTTSVSYNGYATRDDVFTAGEDSPSVLRGGLGSDVYVISRFQSRNVTVADTSGNDIVKLDIGLSIMRLVAADFGLNVEITLTSGALVTVDNPARFGYQIADDEVMSWTEFLAEIGSGIYV
ncbi:MAG: hypothetical protein OXT03_00300, partial [Alphaproteobacteria bacterium]|nr:hypothetical protein [Alphaproteobacteria bacterium]